MAEGEAFPTAGEADPIKQPVAIYAGWAPAALTFLLTMVGSGTVFYSYSIYAVAFRAAFGASQMLINLGFSAVMVMSGACAFIVSACIRRWGMVRVGIGGCIGTASGLALVSMASSMAQVIFLFATLVPLADTLLGAVLCNTLITQWFERRRGLVMGIMMMGASAAAIVYPPLTGALVGAIGWRGTFLIHAGSLLLLMPFVWLWARPPSEPIPSWERLERVPAEVAPHVTAGGARKILTDPRFWGVTAAVGALNGLNGGIMISLVPFAVSHGIGQTQGAYLVSAIGVVALFGKMGFGLLADRADLRMVMRLALLCMATGQVILLTSARFELWLVSSALFGLSLGGMYPVWGAIFAQFYSGRVYTSALGWSRTFMTPPAFGLPILAGYVYDRTGNYALNWMIYLGVTAAALAATWIGARGTRPSR